MSGLSDINFKSPWVIGGGVLIGAFLLLSRSGGNSSQASGGISSTDAANLQAYQLGVQQNIALGQASIAAQSANYQAQANLAGQQALANASSEQNIANTIGGVINTNSTNNASIINNITAGVTQMNLATIGANTTQNVVGMQTRSNVALANINAGVAAALGQDQVNIANINAQASQNNATTGVLGNVFNSLINQGGQIGLKAVAAG